MQNILLDFVNGAKVIEVDNATDMKRFIAFLKKYDIYDSLICNKKYADEYEKISFYRHIAKINNGGEWLRPNSPIYFEFQYGKGITFYWKRKEVIDWYGEGCIMKI